MTTMPQTDFRPGTTSSGLVLRYVFQTVLRGRWLLVGTLGVTLALALGYLALASPVFEARSSLIVAPEKQPGEFDFTGLGVSRDVAVEMEVLRSLDVAKRVAERLLSRGHRDASVAAFPILNGEEGPITDPLVLARLLQERLSVEQVRRDVRLIRVGFSSTNPDEAALLANLYAEEYQRRNVEMSRAEAAGLREFVEGQLQSRRDSLRAVEQALQAYREQENAVALDEEARQLAQRMADLQATRDQAQVEYEMAQAELRSLMAEVQGIQPNLATRVSSGLEQRIAAMQQEIARREVEVEAKYARNPALRGREASDPQLVRDLEELTRLREKVREQGERFVEEVLATGGIDPDVAGRLGEEAGIQGALANVSRLRQQITEKTIQASGLRARMAVLDERLRRYDREFERIPAQARTLAALERRQRSMEATYDWLQSKYEEARIAEASEIGYVQILDRAERPSDPVSPRPVYTLVLALLLGGMIGAVWVFGREVIDDRIRRPEDLQAAGVPLLGVIPSFTRAWRRGKGDPLDRVVVHTAPGSAGAAAFHRIVAGLETGRDPGHRVVLVTSPGHREGTTLTALNVAAGLAQAGHKTLLLDASAGAPGAEAAFGFEAAPGLSNLLAGEAFMRDSVRATPVPGLFVLPAGDVPMAPGGLLGSRDLDALMTYLARSFDRIVLDAGDLLAAGTAMALVERADQILLVVRAGLTPGADAAACLQWLRERDFEAGIVLNDFDARAAYGYYRRRGLYGRYGRGAELERPASLRGVSPEARVDGDAVPIRSMRYRARLATRPVEGAVDRLPEKAASEEWPSYRGDGLPSAPHKAPGRTPGWRRLS